MTSGDDCDLLCLDLPQAERIRGALPGLTRLEAVSARARSLGDPTRLNIAAALADGDELCVCDTAWIVGTSQALVSHHLRQLRAAGVVTSRKDGRMVMYRISGEGRAALTALLGPHGRSAVTSGTGIELGGADRV